MENPGNQTGEAVDPVEDPPPPVIAAQDQSTSESLADSSGQRRPQPPLSPLTGCYLLIVIGEPHSERHKEIILQKIAKAFLSWDVDKCHVSLEKELLAITGQSPEGEEARYGERLIQYATENLVTEILIHPQLNTLHQCMKNLLSSFTKHRHIIHAGYTFAGNGSWIIQDGTLSISDLVEALHEPEVLRVLKAYENSVSIDVHCAPEGDWTTERFQKEPVSKLCTIRVNPDDVMTAGNSAISAFIDYLSPFLEPANIQQLLQPTDVVGNIRFTHPTLYVFPGGQGDAALFGINGFNMLIDGGFARKACFWDFARHLDRLDAVLLTRLNNSTVNGISAVLQRKKMNHVYPQIGHFFCNLQDRKIALSPDGDKDKDSLIVNLAEEGQEIVANLRHLALKPHPCYRDGNQIDPVNLYHKVGHGKLDMYVISPARDSQAVKEFLDKWTTNDSRLFSNTGKKTAGKAFEFPLQNLVSICALLVWQPANPNDTITRILFPGSTPQHKIFEGLEKLRHLEFLKHPVCSARSMSPSASTVTVTRSVSKTRQPKAAENKPAETKPIAKPQVKPTKPKTEKTPLKDVKSKLDTNKLLDEKKEVEIAGEEPLKKIDNRILSKDEQIENIKKEIHKIELAENEEQKKKVAHRSKYDMKNVKSKVDSRAPSKSIDRKKVSEKKVEGEASPPSTPKKAMLNGSATKKEKTKITAKPIKVSSPSTTPAKSAKEANNRKVVEARVTRSSSKSLTRKKEETPPPPSTVGAPKTERKPISRRPKAPASPIKAAGVKATKAETEPHLKKVTKKPEAEVTVAKTVGKKITELQKGAETEKTELQEKKNDALELKTVEEKEINKNKETELMAVNKQLKPTSSQESTKNKEDEDEEEEVEEEEEEEYLIITKEESTEESVKGDDSQKDNESVQEEPQTKDETEGEGEIKKLLREEEESEKKQKPTDEETYKEEKLEDKSTEKEGEVEDKIMREEDQEDKEDKEEDQKELQEEKENEKVQDNLPKELAEKSPEVKESEAQKLPDMDEEIDTKESASKEHKEGESLPEEKISNTVETSATTAPTLPEDEKIEELVAEKEEKVHPEETQEIVEEKYIQEETKEEKPKQVVEVQPQQPAVVPTKAGVEELPAPIPTQKKPRDVVKTPDEVADLPMHEEVDPRMYTSGEFAKDLQKKPSEEDLIEQKKDGDTKLETTDKEITDKIAPVTLVDSNKFEEKEDHKAENKEKEPIEEVTGSIATKYLNIIDELEKSAPVPTGEVAEHPSEEHKENEKKLEEKESTDEPKKTEIEEGKPSMKEEVEEPSQKKKQETEEPDETKVEEEDVKEEISDKKTSDEVDKTATHPDTDIVKPDEHDLSGKSTPKDLGRISPNGSLPVDTDVKASEIAREHSDRTTPQKLEEDVSGKSTPLDFSKVVASGKSTPLNLESKLSGKSTPHDLEKEYLETGEKQISRESTPQHSDKEISGKTTPVEREKETSLVSAPQDYPKEAFSEKSVPLDVEKTASEKSTPLKAEADLDQQTISRDLKELEKQVASETTMPDLKTDVPSESVLNAAGEETTEKTPLAPEIKEVIGKLKIEETVISGRSTPEGTVEVQAESLERSTPQDLTAKIISQDKEEKAIEQMSPKHEEIPESPVKKITPQIPDVDLSQGNVTEGTQKLLDKSTPLDLNQDMVKKHTPQESGRSTPYDSDLEPVDRHTRSTSGKSTPQDEEKDAREISTKHTSGKNTPQDLEKKPGEEITLTISPPPDLSQSLSGKSTPQDLKEEIAEKKSPIETDKSTSDNSTPRQDLDKSSSEKSPQLVSGSEISYESEKEPSGKSTPLDLEQELSGKSSPLDLVSKVVSLDLEKEQSGTSSPLQDSSGRISPRELKPDVPKDIHHLGEEPSDKLAEEDKSNSVSATSRPCEVDNEIRRGSQTFEKEIKIHLNVEVSRESTPHKTEGTSSGKSTPKDLSGRVTPQEVEKVASGRVTPQEIEKVASGRVTPQEVEKVASGRVTPQEVEKVASGRVTPQKVEKVASGRVTPQEVEKVTSGRVTPQEVEKVASGRVTPQEVGKVASGRVTPQEVGKVASGRVTPQEVEKVASGRVTPQEVGKVASGRVTPQEVEKVASGRVTPPEVEKSLPQEVQKPTSGKSSPQDLKDISQDKIALERKSVEDSLPLQLNKNDVHGRDRRESQDDKKEKSEERRKSKEITDLEKEQATDRKDFITTKEEGSRKSSTEISTAVKEFQDAIRTPSPTQHLEKKDIQKPIEDEKSPIHTSSAEVSTKSDTAKDDKPESSDKKILLGETSVSDSVSSGPVEKETSGKSTPVSTNKETPRKASSPVSEKPLSDSASIAAAEKDTSAAYSLEKESLHKSSPPSPVDISPLPLDEIKESKEELQKGKETHYEEKELENRKSPAKHSRTPSDVVVKNPLERIKYEDGDSSRASTPDRSHFEKSDISIPNGVESEEEMEKGILESERQEKESQILGVSSEDEEELKALGVDDDDVDSEVDVKKEKEPDGPTPSSLDSTRADIRKGEKEDINQLVKIGVKEIEKDEEDSDQKSGVKRMLVTASSEDGGAETEICIQGGVKTLKDIIGGEEEKLKSDEEEFSNLILEARKEYHTQRSRKTSCNSSTEEIEPIEEVDNVEGEGEHEEGELSTLLKQARQELALVRSKIREGKDESDIEMLNKTKTIQTTETTHMDGSDLITITTILTEEREEQEDGSIKVTRTKETTTKGGAESGTVVSIKTNVESRRESEIGELSSLQTHSSTSELDYDEVVRSSKEEGEEKMAQGEETSRRTSISSIISHEDLVSRKDSSKIDDFRTGAAEMSPLKTTYITSHGDSESLMTSSFYGNLPMEDEMRAEHMRAFRKERGYESFTEIGPNGERTERTYFYETDEPSTADREKHRFVKTYYAEEEEEEEEDVEDHEKDGNRAQYVQKYYATDIPEEESSSKEQKILRKYHSDKEAKTEHEKYRFVKAPSPTGMEEHLDFAKAVDEHVSVRGEYLGQKFQQDKTKYSNGKKTEGESSEDETKETSSREPKREKDEPKKDVIESWGKPLGLPLPPKNLNKTYAFSGQNISTTSSLSTPSDNSDSVTNWGQPMSLPSPAPPLAQNGVAETLPEKTANTGKETPRKEKLQLKKAADSKSSGTNTPNRRSESPVKQAEKRAPSTGRTSKSSSGSHLYLDLTYVPHHGNSYYINVEFFKKVRARYYVFSGTEPSKEVYNALLEAKQTWEDKKLEVTIIPTYDTDVLGYWVAENEEILAKHKIDLSPSASRCTINLQDHETSCSAYRLEF